VILPSVEKAAIASLRKMVTYKGSEPMARAVSQNTVKMLNNMMRHPTYPIHPVAFYAAVKDFESAGSLNWSNKSGSGISYFRTGNCTSGECFGLFQVDVRLESTWRGGAFCQSQGLNLWTTTVGGADFCATQFWWTMADGGQKCAALSNYRSNPCTSSNYTWTLNEVRKGRAAYVQAIQPGWDNRAWEEMYSNYERCYTDKIPLLKSITQFKVDVGLIDSESTNKDPASKLDNFTSEPVYQSTPVNSPVKFPEGPVPFPAAFGEPEIATPPAAGM